MSNILEAIVGIANLPQLDVQQLTFGNNRANNVGDGLEIFIKDAFSNNLTETNEENKLQAYSRIFSYEGSLTRPPDLMIRGGDAIEVKKTESITSELQLNSSHPKAKLYSSSSLINAYCRDCETWDEKDIIYTVGHIPKNSKVLSSLWMIYGNIYAADEDVYTGLKSIITDSIQANQDINFSETNELGRVNFVDPLKITNMRIRGMWLLQPPVKVFDYRYTYDARLKFQLVAIIPEKKYYSFPESSRKMIEGGNIEYLDINSVEIKNPNNPVNMVLCKLITLRVPN
jgi:hypothetical protein